MKRIKYIFFFLCICSVLTCTRNDDSTESQDPPNEELYFPPIDTDTWETKSISELNWNESELQPLLNFLEEKNSKSFIILHEGKIVVENYFDGHTNTSPWYWASAGKTLTTAVTGIAEEEGLINIEDKVSDYLGTNWTSAPLDKENLITCKNLLTMTSGLNDNLGEDISAANLEYLADAGTRWAYHNVHKRLQGIVEEASNQSWSNYFNAKLKDRIGMTGLWIDSDNFNVYWSNTRSMARFGLLSYANGKWEEDQILPEAFFTEAINTSQSINLSYGYMWWLNGKTSYMLPQTQTQFNGALIPNAPSDMYAALGRDDQKIYVIPSKKLVVIRMGNAAENTNFALSNFDNDLWEKINALIN